MKRIPFPQANNIELLYQTLISIDDYGMSKEDFSKINNIDVRQGSYYLDALLFLNFVEKINTKYFLNENGLSIVNADEKDRKKSFALKMLKNSQLYKYYSDTRNMDKKQVLQYLEESIALTFKVSNSTAHRRASTISNWVRWIRDILGNGE